MLKKLAIFLAVTLGCLTAGCSGGGERDPSDWEAEPAPAAEASAPDPSELPPGVMSEILSAVPQDLKDFSYFDNPALVSRGDGAVFPAGASETTYSCGLYDGPYADEEKAFTHAVAEALAEFAVDGPPEVVDEKPLLPEGRYFTVWPTLHSEWNPVLTFFDSGEIYVDFNGGEDGVARRWQAADPRQFDALQAVLEEIHQRLDARPLDYQVELWLSPDHFRPESEALRFGFRNRGRDTLTVDTLAIERQTADGWQTIGEARAPDLEIAPRGYSWYAVDLTGIDGAQEAGQYRVTGAVRGNGEALPLELPYAIDEEAYETSWPFPPKMTVENQAYCDRYVGMWGFYSPFETDFDEQNYIQEFHTYHLYHMMAYPRGLIEEHQERYGLDLPAEVVEDVILRHFLVTAEQIRAQTPTREQNPNEYYDPATSTYHFEGGYGGVGLECVVSESRREGDLLTLRCDWYSGADSGYAYSQELTLRLGEGELDFVYLSGRML